MISSSKFVVLISSILTLSIYTLIIVISNTAQYLSTGPNFLGLSGLIFGLVGFLAVSFPQSMIPGTVRFFAVWFLACIALTSFNVFPIANAAHGFGALAGAMIGVLWNNMSHIY